MHLEVVYMQKSHKSSSVEKDFQTVFYNRNRTNSLTISAMDQTPLNALLKTKDPIQVFYRQNYFNNFARDWPPLPGLLRKNIIKRFSINRRPLIFY